MAIKCTIGYQRAAKVEIIKAVRIMLGLGLVESKHVVDGWLADNVGTVPVALTDAQFGRLVVATQNNAHVWYDGASVIPKEDVRNDFRAVPEPA